MLQIEAWCWLKLHLDSNKSLEKAEKEASLNWDGCASLHQHVMQLHVRMSRAAFSVIISSPDGLGCQCVPQFNPTGLSLSPNRRVCRVNDWVNEWRTQRHFESDKVQRKRLSAAFNQQANQTHKKALPPGSHTLPVVHADVAPRGGDGATDCHNQSLEGGEYRFKIVTRVEAKNSNKPELMVGWEQSN